MESKPIKVALWCVPRSLSSVFCKSIAEVDNSIVFFEYHCAAIHSGPDQNIPNPRIGRHVFEPKFTYKYVKEELETEHPGKELYFFKDMAYALGGEFDRLPEGYQHTFLIRHPAYVFKSYNALLTEKIGLPSLKSFLPEGFAFKEMYALFEHVTKTLNQKTVIIDAEDLKANPEGIMRTYCDATGIPFRQSLLSWKPEVPNPPEWKAPLICWMGNKQVGIYNEAFDSTGFKRIGPEPINIEELTGQVKECTEISLPYYDKLYELRIKPT